MVVLLVLSDDPVDLYRQRCNVAPMADQHAELKDQVIDWQRLKRFGSNQAGGVATNAGELIEHSLYQAFASTGRAIRERDLAAHKGGAMLLFIHF
jgi:hypothetical protein